MCSESLAGSLPGFPRPQAIVAVSDNPWTERAQRWPAWQASENVRQAAAYRQQRATHTRGILTPWFATSLDPAEAFGSFLTWWVEHEALPASLDPQDPAAVRAWLVGFASELDKAWSWYLVQCSARGVEPKVAVFGTAATKAMSVVNNLDGIPLRFPADYYPERLVFVRDLILRGLVLRVDNFRALLCQQTSPVAPSSGPEVPTRVEPQPQQEEGRQLTDNETKVVAFLRQNRKRIANRDALLDAAGIGEHGPNYKMLTGLRKERILDVKSDSFGSGWGLPSWGAEALTTAQARTGKVQE
jgi:hypothetical protein